MQLVCYGTTLFAICCNISLIYEMDKQKLAII